MEAFPREPASQLPQVCYLLKWAVGASPEKFTTSFPGLDVRPRDVHTEYAQYGTSNSHTEYGLRSTSAANPVPRSVEITEPPPALLLSLAAGPPLSPSYPLLDAGFFVEKTCWPVTHPPWAASLSSLLRQLLGDRRLSRLPRVFFPTSHHSIFDLDFAHLEYTVLSRYDRGAIFSLAAESIWLADPCLPACRHSTASRDSTAARNLARSLSPSSHLDVEAPKRLRGFLPPCRLSNPTPNPIDCRRNN